MKQQQNKRQRKEAKEEKIIMMKQQQNKRQRKEVEEEKRK
jgi:hypothetical protein